MDRQALQINASRIKGDMTCCQLSGPHIPGADRFYSLRERVERNHHSLARCRTLEFPGVKTSGAETAKCVQREVRLVFGGAWN
jgi:hypothetical protein